MSTSKKGKQNLKQSENKHIPGNYNKEITHKDYDTFRKTETIKLNNSLDDLVISTIEDIKEFYKYSIEKKSIIKSNEEPLEDIIEYIKYNGDLDSIIDNTVPVYTHELKSLFFINEYALIEAFENSGIGNKSEFESGPLGFEGVAIYCYIEEQINMYLYNGFGEWFSAKFWEVF